MEVKEFIRPAVSLVMLIAGIVADHLGVDINCWLRLAWYVAAFLPVGFAVMREAAESAAKGEWFSEFMLMSVASVGAFIIGEYPEAVAVMLFYCIGETLQDMAVDRARDNIKSLMAFRPDTARVISGGKEHTASPDDVSIGSTIEVRPGERVPLDGVLAGETAAFNTAALTGESIPRTIDSGGEVLAGMIATDSVVRISVTRKAGDSAVSRILNMVEEASARKAPAELFIRKFAHVYTPAVMCLAALTAIVPWLWSLIDGSYAYDAATWVYRALIFLVISCPCALVISIPLSYFGGIGAASRQGILFKGGNWLDAIASVDTVMFDKTGTLTKGEFEVSELRVDELRVDGSGLRVDGRRETEKEREMLRAVSSIERTSSHPIAKAVVKYAEKYNDADRDDAVAEDVKNIPGYGISGTVDGSRWLAGTLQLLKRDGIAYPKELDNEAKTIVACAKDGQFAGYMTLGDRLKDDAHEAVRSLRHCGVKNIEILSGDKQALADEIGSMLETDACHGDLMPEDKARIIAERQQQGHRVAFVGDGINDAPVLATSDVGIAMGGLGADMAIETADVVIQTDSPSKVATAIRLSRRTRSIVKQNVTMALAVKVAVMLLGLLGLTNLWLAVFADVGVALLAVLNAMRIMRS